MTPEVEAILQRIGWDVVSRASPALALQLAHQFQTPAAGVLVSTDASARDLADRVRGLGESAFALATGLLALPENVRQNVDLTSLNISEIQGGEEGADLVEEVQSALWRLMRGLAATEARLRFEGGQNRRGNPKNLVPHAIAFAAAQIYVIGMGSLPAAHNETAGHEVRGIFGKVVEDLFDAMGLGFDAIGPARAAIARLEGLSDEEWAGLMLVRCPVTRTNIKAEWVRRF